MFASNFSKIIVWSAIALLIGTSLGFGFRHSIASLLGVSALETQQAPKINARTIDPATDLMTLDSDPDWTNAQIKDCLAKGGIWTGNGCAKPWLWTPTDWNFFRNCLDQAMSEPPPPLTEGIGITHDEYILCVKQTEMYKGRPH